MTITNGYCTLAQLKQRLQDMRTYTAATLSFATSKVITDTAYGVGRFNVGDVLLISGSASNDKYVTVTANTSSTITVSESLATEAAGESVTISQRDSVADAVNPANDSLLEDIITEASRWIDDQTGMTFYAATETRKYIVGEHTDGATLWLDKPLISVTTLTNGDDEVLTASTEYILMEPNGPPYHKVILIANGGKAWDYSTDRLIDMIEVVGTWGNYSTAPAPIRAACLLLASRLYKRKDAIFGVAGTSALGEVRLQFPQDRDVMSILENYTMPIGYNYG